MAILFALVTTSCTVVPEKPKVVSTSSYKIAVASGSGQKGIAGKSLASSFSVNVSDGKGGTPNDANVDWKVTAGGGSLVTSTQGQMTALLTLGTTVGLNTVTATIHGSSDQVVTFTATGVVGPASSSKSSIVGSGPVENDGINSSTITITLKDAFNNAIEGTVPTFKASGSANTYGTCSSSDSSGVSTCTLKSTTAETKILALLTPVSMVGGTVVFAPGPVSASNSTITGTSTTVANGVATSTITITLKDASNVAVSGVVPTFSATDTGATNSYGTCSITNTSGVSTCTLASTVAEVKTLSITSPVSVTASTVTFVAGPASSLHTTITGTTPIEPDGSSTSVISVSLKDANNNSISGTVPTFSATDTGSTNVYGACTSSDASGLSTCHLSSTVSETKTLSLLTPLSLTGGTVVFAPTAVVAANSSITGTSTVVADGVATSTITITLKDISHVAVGGVVPTFSATNTGGTNTYGTCTSSNASTGISTCTLTSTKAEIKTLSLTSPVSFAGGTVTFVAGPFSSVTSTITGSGPVVADGSSTSSVSITLLDAFSNPISSVVPTFSATDTGVTNSYGSCTSSNASGVSSCTLSSTKAEIKTLSIVSPGSVGGGTVTFTHGNPSIATSSIVGTGPVSPDGSSTSSITVTLLDAFSNPVNGVVPTFSATDTGSTNIYGACSSSTVAGLSTCTLASLHSETKTLSLQTPIAMSGGTVVFTPGAASALNSSITGTGSVTADGFSASTITITLKDASNVPIVGTVPTFTATNTANGNGYGACSATNASGVSTCSLTSTRAEVKTLALASPVSLSGGTVTFTAGAVSALTSQITGTGPVTADGTTSSAISIVLYDANNNPISGVIPSFSATDTGFTNIYGACSSSSATGLSTCTLKSTHAETKTLSIVSPVSVTSGTVTFTAQAASASTSTITASGPVNADGTSASTVTITLLDVNSNPVAGSVPTFSATNTGGTNAYGTCSTSNVLGISTCTLKSTHAEVKTLTLATPVSVTGGTVTFAPGVASASTSSITGTGAVNADGVSTSTITITLKDVNNNSIVGTVPSFTATDTGATNIYGACSATNASGISTCTLAATHGETKTLNLTSPISFAGGTVVFTALPSSTYSSITGTGSVTANGVATSTITVTLKDYSNSAISGIVPTFSATDTGSTNVMTACSSTNASGISTCTLKSTKAETKTLSLVSPISFAGGTVSFVAGSASTLTSTITGTGSVVANGTSASTVTITLLDANNNSISGITPTFDATDTGASNLYGSCSSTNASGVSTCTLKSNYAEVKTLNLLTPISKTGGTITFTQAVSSVNSSIVGSGPVNADGTSASTVTITLNDYANLPVAGITPTFSATDTGSTNAYGACSVSDASGLSTCTLKSTQAETKTLTLNSPISMSGSSVVFTPVASPIYSTITGTGPVLSDGVDSSTITITLKDYSNTAISGVTPTFSATDTGGTNVNGACSSSDVSGVSTCTLNSTVAETKTLSITSPVVVSGGSVIFY